jgi:hypothetical protein
MGCTLHPQYACTPTAWRRAHSPSTHSSPMPKESKDYWPMRCVLAGEFRERAARQAGAGVLNSNGENASGPMHVRDAHDLANEKRTAPLAFLSRLCICTMNGLTAVSHYWTTGAIRFDVVSKKDVRERCASVLSETYAIPYR